jgi:hypothetical protein
MFDFKRIELFSCINVIACNVSHIHSNHSHPPSHPPVHDFHLFRSTVSVFIIIFIVPQHDFIQICFSFSSAHELSTKAMKKLLEVELFFMRHQKVYEGKSFAFFGRSEKGRGKAENDFHIITCLTN